MTAFAIFAMFYYKQSKSSNILLNIKLSEVFERNQGVPNGDERKSEEKSERSPKFRKERLPRINQLFLLDLKQTVLCFLQNPTVVSLAVAQIPNPSAAPNPDILWSITKSEILYLLTYLLT